jgi:hypothetical protein
LLAFARLIVQNSPRTMELAACFVLTQRALLIRLAFRS